MKWDFCCCKSISQQSESILNAAIDCTVCLFASEETGFAAACRPTLALLSYRESRCRPPARPGAGSCGCGRCIVPRRWCWSQPCTLLLWCLMLAGKQGMMWITWSKENSGEWQGLRTPLLTRELEVSHAVENPVAHWRWHHYLWREIKLIHSPIWNLKKRG